MADIINNPGGNKENLGWGIIILAIVGVALVFLFVWGIDTSMVDENETNDAFRGDVINDEDRIVPTASPVFTPSPSPTPSPTPSEK